MTIFLKLDMFLVSLYINNVVWNLCNDRIGVWITALPKSSKCKNDSNFWSIGKISVDYKFSRHHNILSRAHRKLIHEDFQLSNDFIVDLSQAKVCTCVTYVKSTTSKHRCFLNVHIYLTAFRKPTFLWLFPSSTISGETFFFKDLPNP